MRRSCWRRYFSASSICFFCLASIPGVLPHRPSMCIMNFFEQFSLLCGAIALYAATEPNAERAAGFGRMARLGLGACATSFTLSQIFYLSATAELVPKWIPPNQTFWAILTRCSWVQHPNPTRKLSDHETPAEDGSKRQLPDLN